MIQPSATIWFGPVDTSQVHGASAPGTKPIHAICKGDGVPSCSDIADAFLKEDGRSLPALLESLVVPVHSEVVLGAFSAGGSVVKRLLVNGLDRAQVAAVLLSDATYMTTEIPDGFVRFGIDAAQDNGSLFVATASSSPNKSWPTGAQTLDAIRGEIEKRTGRKFSFGSLPGVLPKPKITWRLGNILFADYGGTITHGEHATVLAPQVWKNVLDPWLLGADPGVPVGPGGPSVERPVVASSPIASGTAFAVAALGAFLGIRWAGKRRS